MKTNYLYANHFAHLQRLAGGALLVMALFVLGGCAQIQLGAPSPSMDNLQKARASVAAPVAVGNFTAALATKDSGSTDAGINVRSNTVSSPVDGSFAKYLQESLSTELKAAGLLDPKSGTTVRGQLTDSQLDAGANQGKGSLAARFVVERAGRSVYDKELRAQSLWDSSFVGAIAIPAAINEYTLLYRKLVGQLLDDAGFRAAVAK